ncbi:KRAB-A domain-containing protein 2-like [Argiope bruennichi]|uniref:KRAB-A domain-containing protein 2-like n=1 Tax=Argiope bruennichi TaxID=94029 RepID=UPI002495439F|nr:KRAB-A domain-containing protein 2-like [Argiope bruennichi]
MDSNDTRVPVDEFNAALWRRYHNGKIRNVYPLIKYNDIIEKIKTIEENPPCNTPGEYYLLRKFIVVNINGKERLSCKPENCILAENSQEVGVSTKFYVALEEIYGFLNEAHKWIKHGCRDRIVRKLQSQGIVNITRDTVELFLSFCKLCRPGKNSASRRIGPKSQSVQVSGNPVSKNIQEIPLTIENGTENTVLKNLLSSEAKTELNQNNSIPQTTVCTFTRGFIDLIDYSFSPDGDYRYVFLYMDVQTCLCALYPVRCKCTFEIVSHLLSVFTLLGPPQVLHSNFENNFLFSIIQELKQALPELILVSGSTNYAEVQEVAQNCICEVNSMLKTWMCETKSNHWSYGLKLVQLRKNTKIPCNSSKSSYECFFGHSLNSNLSSEIDINLLKKADKEENLLSLINEQNLSEKVVPSSQQTCEHLQVSLDPKICSLVQNNVPSDLLESENEQNLSPVIKPEPLSDTEAQKANGFEISDSSNDSCMSPGLGNLEIVIKQEVDDEDS